MCVCVCLCVDCYLWTLLHLGKNLSLGLSFKTVTRPLTAQTFWDNRFCPISCLPWPCPTFMCLFWLTAVAIPICAAALQSLIFTVNEVFQKTLFGHAAEQKHWLKHWESHSLKNCMSAYVSELRLPPVHFAYFFESCIVRTGLLTLCTIKVSTSALWCHHKKLFHR